MKIELKNIKIHHGLSEETHCYTATIYVDGKRAFDASNHGHGGADDYWPVKGYEGPDESAISAWLKENRPPIVGPDYSLEMNLEMEVSNLLDAHIAAEERKRITRSFDRILSKSIAAIRDGKLITWKAPPTPANLAAIKAKNPTVEILNGADAALRERGLLAYCPDLATA